MNPDLPSSNPWIQLMFVAWLVALAINFAIANAVGKAARKKDRSYKSFFWLTIVLGWPITALVIAALPFDKADPRHPNNNFTKF